MLVVALPHTPGATELAGAETEAATLRHLLPGTRVLSGHEARCRDVLAALPEHRWVHFACHAISDTDHPDAGRLLLHDHRDDPLVVPRLSRLRLDRAELAYLSACETTQLRHELADEPLHLTGAFLIAGYAHVVGTLGPVDDEVAAQISADFYAALAANGRAIDAADVGWALQCAVARVRDDYPDTPTLWAGHLHVGG